MFQAGHSGAHLYSQSLGFKSRWKWQDWRDTPHSVGKDLGMWKKREVSRAPHRFLLGKGAWWYHSWDKVTDGQVLPILPTAAPLPPVCGPDYLQHQT
jgi:hypothetical protein